jgi:hypothetical protein
MIESTRHGTLAGWRSVRLSTLRRRSPVRNNSFQFAPGVVRKWLQLHRHLAGRQLEHLGGVRGGQTVTEDSTEEPVVNSSTLARRRDASCSVAPQETLMPTIGYGLHDPRGERRGLERLSVGVQRGPDGSGELGSQPPIRSGVAAG